MACDDKHLGGIWQVTWQTTHTHTRILLFGWYPTP